MITYSDFHKNKVKLSSFLENLSPFWWDFLPRFFLFLCVFGLFLFPIIHANFHYNDDWYHIASPVKVMRDGRPVQQIILWFFCTFSTTDVAPLFQIVGAVLVAVGAALASIAFSYRMHSGLLALSFLFCNEFFLENLSYRFESIGMSLGIALTLAVFYVPIALKNKHLLFQWGSIVAVLVVSLGSYQPAINLYGGITCLAAIMEIFRHNDLNKVWHLFLSRIGAFTVSLILYRLIVAIIPPFHNTYAAEHSAMVHSFSEIFDNFQAFFHFFLLLIKPWNEGGLCNYGAFLLILILFGAISFFFHLFHLWLEKKSLLPILSVFCFFSSIFIFFAGPMLLLASPVLVPRVMCGISIILMASVTFLLELSLPAIFKKIMVGYISYLLYGSLVASAAYGNASHMLENYRLALDTQMRDDIAYHYYSPAGEAFRRDGRQMFFVMTGNKKRFTPQAVQYIEHKYPVFQTIFIQKVTWNTAFPAMAWDSMRFNLIGGGYFMNPTIPFILPIDDLNPATIPIRNYIMKRVNACQVNDIRKHTIFFTYRVGSYVVFDYDQRCSISASLK